jgi:hypothetical protein
MDSGWVNELQSLRPGDGFVNVLGDPLTLDLAGARCHQAFCRVDVDQEDGEAFSSKTIRRLSVVPSEEAVILI